MIVKWVCDVWVCLFMCGSMRTWTNEKTQTKILSHEFSMVFDECANPIKTEMIKAIEQLRQQQNILYSFDYNYSLMIPDTVSHAIGHIYPMDVNMVYCRG